MSIAVRISTTKSGKIKVKRINYERFSFHGFGSFIWQVKPSEISISPKALELLASRIGRQYTSMGDLAGLSLHHYDTQYDSRHNGYSLNYGFLGYELVVPLEDVIIDWKFYQMLETAVVEQVQHEFDERDKAHWDEMIKLEAEGKQKESDNIYKEFYQKEFYP